MSFQIIDTRIRAVIFDLDGVICDTEPLHIQSWQMLFASKQLDVTHAELAACIGLPDLTLLRRVFARHHIEDDVHEWRILKRNIYLELLQQSVPEFPGAVQLVRQLSWNWPVAIASSAWRIAIETVTRRLAIREYVKTIIAKEDVTSHKPAPEPFLLAANELGVEPAACVVIEDSVAGIKAANAAGMTCVAVTNSFEMSQLTEADLVIESLEQTAPIYGVLTGRRG